MYAKSGKWTCQVETDQIRLTKGGNDFRQIATVKMNSEVDLDLDMALAELNSSRWIRRNRPKTAQVVDHHMVLMSILYFRF